MSPDDEVMIQFNEMCDRVRIYLEVAKAIEGLPPKIYEGVIDLEDSFLSEEVTDQDDVEMIVSTIAEALSPSSPSFDF